MRHALENPRCGLWAGMGSGKTSAAETLLHELELVEPGRSLVLAPLRVARDTWPNEAAMWEHLRRFSVVPIVGSEAERRAALKLDVSCHTINYDVLPWLIEYHLENKLTWRWSRVVGDESTRLKNFRLRNGGQRAQAIAKVAHKNVRRWINLTGTPAPNGLIDQWGQTWFLDQGKRLGRTIEDFRKRWFQFDQYARQYDPLQYAQEQIHAALSDICLTPTLPFNVEEPVVRPVYVELPARARRQYDEMEKKMFAEISGHEIEALTAAAKTIKCLQIASGAAYLDSEDGVRPDQRKWVDVHDQKLQALESIMAEAAGMPVLVAYHFKSDKARILKAFPRAVDVATQDGMKKFMSGRYSPGVGHPASMGHGLDGMQDVTNICALFTNWWNLEEYQQFIARIGPVRQAQSGHKRPVFVYPIVAKDTVEDWGVLPRRESKRDVQDILLEAMKRKSAGHLKSS